MFKLFRGVSMSSSHSLVSSLMQLDKFWVDFDSREVVLDVSFCLFLSKSEPTWDVVETIRDLGWTRVLGVY